MPCCLVARFCRNTYAEPAGNEYNVIATGHGDDIRDRGVVRRLVKRANPAIVVNFASITTVRESLKTLRGPTILVFGNAESSFCLKEHGLKEGYLMLVPARCMAFPRRINFRLVRRPLYADESVFSK